MQHTAAIVVLLLLATRVGFACTTEETLLASLQATAEGVQMKHRFDAPYAQKFLELFTRETEANDPPLVDRVVIYSKPGASTHKVAAFFAGCMRGHGYVTHETYNSILDKLRLAMSL